MSSVLSPQGEAPPSYGIGTIPIPFARPGVPAPPLTVDAAAAVKPRPLATVPILTADRLAAEKPYSDAVAAWTAGRSTLEGLRQFAYSTPGTVTVSELRDRRDKIQAAELKLSQDAVTLARDFVGHAEARAAELKLFVEVCEDLHESTEAEVVGKLNGIGITVESQSAYPANVEAARHTFKLRIKESADWQAADRKLSEAKGAHTAAVESVSAGRSQIAKAEAALAAVVKRLAGC